MLLKPFDLKKKKKPSFLQYDKWYYIYLSRVLQQIDILSFQITSSGTKALNFTQWNRVNRVSGNQRLVLEAGLFNSNFIIRNKIANPHLIYW